MADRCYSCAFSGDGHYGHCIEGYREDIGLLLDAIDEMRFETCVIEGDKQNYRVPAPEMATVARMAAKLRKRVG